MDLVWRVTIDPVAGAPAPGPIHSGRKFSLSGEISSIAGEGYSRYFGSTRQLSQQGFRNPSLPFRAPGFPGEMQVIPD